MILCDYCRKSFAEGQDFSESSANIPNRVVVKTFWVAKIFRSDKNQDMFIRPINVTKNGKRHAYWSLVESHRTERGPRQRVVAYLGKIDEAGRLGIQRVADDSAVVNQQNGQQQLFEKSAPKTEPEWIEIDTKGVRVENCRRFGDVWLALELIRKLELDQFFEKIIPAGREEIPWSNIAQILMVARLCEPSSELSIAEIFYPKTALSDLLGIPAAKIDDNRLYRALDKILPHKEELEIFLKEKLGSLFDLEYDLLMYDVTSTYCPHNGSKPFALRCNL